MYGCMERECMHGNENAYVWERDSPSHECIIIIILTVSAIEGLKLRNQLAALAEGYYQDSYNNMRFIYEIVSHDKIT